MAQFIITENQLILIKENFITEKKQNEEQMVNEAAWYIL